MGFHVDGFFAYDAKPGYPSALAVRVMRKAAKHDIWLLLGYPPPAQLGKPEAWKVIGDTIAHNEEMLSGVGAIVWTVKGAGPATSAVEFDPARASRIADSWDQGCVVAVAMTQKPGSHRF
jgi:hypothetical protein